MKNQMIPKTSEEALEMGFVVAGGEYTDDATGPSIVVRKGYFEFEDGVGAAPLLRIPYMAQITFGKPYQPRNRSKRQSKPRSNGPSNVIMMPLRKAS